MSEPIRRRLVEVLASGEHTAGELCDVIQNEFGVTRSAVSRHLTILKENEWVIVRAEWCNRLYRLDDAAIVQLRREVRRLEKIWARRIGVIARNDPVPWHTEPIDKRRRPRAVEGSVRGLRGQGVRDDPWQRTDLGMSPSSGGPTVTARSRLRE